MRKKTLQVITLGCSKNTVDTEHLLAQVQDDYVIVPEGETEAEVDCLLLNTCGFIGDAKEESVQAVFAAVDNYFLIFNRYGVFANKFRFPACLIGKKTVITYFIKRARF